MSQPTQSKYPARQRFGIGAQRAGNTERRSPRTQRIFDDLTLLIFIMGLLYLAHQSIAALAPKAPAPPLPPLLDFALVAQRWDKIHHYDSRARVHSLLGPPTQPHCDSPELRRLETQAKERPLSYIFPDPRIADQWTDPNDQGKWVLVIFSDGKVYLTIKHGF
jgi:hypothetical protein